MDYPLSAFYLLILLVYRFCLIMKSYRKEDYLCSVAIFTGSSVSFTL